MKRPDLIIHLVNSAHGVYVPQVFAEMAATGKWEGIDPEDLAIIKAEPDNPNYWEAWECILGSACITIDGYKYMLHQDGDLWAVRKPKNKKEREDLAQLFGED